MSPNFTTSVAVTAGGARTKHVTLPPLEEPVVMGMHGDVAQHYRVDAGTYEPHPTTIDYLVGAAVACLCGTFGGLLTRLGQPVDGGELTADGTGDLVDDGGTLRLRAIRIDYRLGLADGVDVERVHRAHQRHAALCPIARSIGDSVDLTTRLVLMD